MKRIQRYLLLLIFFTTYAYCLDNNQINNPDTLKINPNIYLNLQDMPIFSAGDNPLAGLQAFNLIPPLSLKDREMQKRAQYCIEKELEKIGEVIHLKSEDMRGFGSGSVLLIQMGDVLAWNGTKLPISRISLQVQTCTILSKTGLKTFPAVWTMNTFLQSPIEGASADNLTKATQKLVHDFVQNYQYTNQHQVKKPIFYTYY